MAGKDVRRRVARQISSKGFFVREEDGKKVRKSPFGGKSPAGLRAGVTPKKQKLLEIASKEKREITKASAKAKAKAFKKKIVPVKKSAKLKGVPAKVAKLAAAKKTSAKAKVAKKKKAA